eukprot:GHVS01074912.1.p1 GENE.GHVS01074912.1~~GHVS01074912.1.p1  ORF type:complete len:110 (+),score=10.43 GHVS01074912.1:2-331(+)
MAKLWIDHLEVKRVSLFWAEIDFDKYGTRLNETIREVLKKNGAHFCMLWRPNENGSVTLRVPGQLKQNNERLWDYLKDLANSEEVFQGGELTVDQDGWKKINKALRSNP